MKKLFVLVLVLGVLVGCSTFTLPFQKTELPLNTSAKITSNIVFTYDKNQEKDFDPETDSITLYIDTIDKELNYSVSDLMTRLRNTPNSLKLELPTKNWFTVEGRVEERIESSFSGYPQYKGQKLWAGVFKYSDGLNEIWLVVNEYNKDYFLNKKTGTIIDLACSLPDLIQTNRYTQAHQLTLKCVPLPQGGIILENPNKK